MSFINGAIPQTKEITSRNILPPFDSGEWFPRQDSSGEISQLIDLQADGYQVAFRVEDNDRVNEGLRWLCPNPQRYAGQTLTISTEKIITLRQGRIELGFNTGGGNTWVNLQVAGEVSINIPQNVQAIIVNVQSQSASDDTIFIKNIQLEIGETATEFQPRLDRNPDNMHIPNLMEARWEQGTISSASGANYADNHPNHRARIRTHGQIPIAGGESYTFNSQDIEHVILEYNEQGNFLRIVEPLWQSTRVFTTHTNTRFIRVIFRHITERNIHPREIPDINPHFRWNGNKSPILFNITPEHERGDIISEHEGNSSWITVDESQDGKLTDKLIEGRTLVNLANEINPWGEGSVVVENTITFEDVEAVELARIFDTHTGFKLGTTYTFLVTVHEWTNNTRNLILSDASPSALFNQLILIPNTTVGQFVVLGTTNNVDVSRNRILRFMTSAGAGSVSGSFTISIYEGDLTKLTLNHTLPRQFASPSNLSVSSIGENLFDGWENGTLNSGNPTQDAPSDTIIRSSIIPVEGGRTLHIRTIPHFGTTMSFFELDINFNVIHRTDASNPTLTLQPNTRYIRFRSGTGAQGITDRPLNLTYDNPVTTHIIPHKSTTQNLQYLKGGEWLPVPELRGIQVDGNLLVSDEITDTEYVQRVGLVDLETVGITAVTWNANGVTRFVLNVAPVLFTSSRDIVSNKLPSIGNNWESSVPGVGLDGNGNAIVHIPIVAVWTFDALRQYLIDNDYQFLVPLAEPRRYPIRSWDLPSHEPVTHVHVDSGTVSPRTSFKIVEPYNRIMGNAHPLQLTSAIKHRNYQFTRNSEEVLNGITSKVNQPRFVRDGVLVEQEIVNARQNGMPDTIFWSQQMQFIQNPQITQKTSVSEWHTNNAINYKGRLVNPNIAENATSMVVVNDGGSTVSQTGLGAGTPVSGQIFIRNNGRKRVRIRGNRTFHPNSPDESSWIQSGESRLIRFRYIDGNAEGTGGNPQLQVSVEGNDTEFDFDLFAPFIHRQAWLPIPRFQIGTKPAELLNIPVTLDNQGGSIEIDVTLPEIHRGTTNNMIFDTANYDVGGQATRWHTLIRANGILAYRAGQNELIDIPLAQLNINDFRGRRIRYKLEWNGNVNQIYINGELKHTRTSTNNRIANDELILGATGSLVAINFINTVFHSVVIRNRNNLPIWSSFEEAHVGNLLSQFIRDWEVGCWHVASGLPNDNIDGVAPARIRPTQGYIRVLAGSRLRFATNNSAVTVIVRAMNANGTFSRNIGDIGSSGEFQLEANETFVALSLRRATVDAGVRWTEWVALMNNGQVRPELYIIG